MNNFVFDWEKAARIIAVCDPGCASVGILRGNAVAKCFPIYMNGRAITTPRTFVDAAGNGSGLPALVYDGRVIPCYLKAADAPEWDTDTIWPAGALEILKKSAREDAECL